MNKIDIIIETTALEEKLKDADLVMVTEYSIVKTYDFILVDSINKGDFKNERINS
ncbi:MAG TPA: hypothetical protein VFD03_01180 [Clostridia bacterium]|nr:hypothetical protein [Clostridia bacterium]